jgi:NAD(P)-dependent dehydrogenase (short-subunit alcohol dehydrogenase family)
MDIAGTAALVTGAGSGLGAATATALAAAGAKVAALDLDLDRARKTAAAFGGLALACDVADPDGAAAAIATARDVHGPAGILVNCAGLGLGGAVVGRTGPIDLGWFEQIVRVNLTGTFNMIRLAAADMIGFEPNSAGERGVIVNTGSTSAYEGQVGQSAYAASKGGVVAMGLALAREFARHGIRVMTISPGPFDTPMFRSMPPNAYQRLLDDAQFPRRPGDPREYGQLVIDIVENPMLNGESIRLDGALRMGPR